MLLFSIMKPIGDNVLIEPDPDWETPFEREIEFR